MKFDDYLTYLRTDGELLAQAGDLGLRADAPCCSGWTVGDVVAHTGVVHRHKLRIIRDRLTENPQPDEAPEDGLVTWYRQGLELLVEVLANTDPQTPAFTWWAADQTVGFWYRRMAQETLVHRVDAEQGHGRISPVAPELAADGIDEVLTKYVGGWLDHGEFVPTGGTIRISPSDHHEAWDLRFGTFTGTSLMTGKHLVDLPMFEVVEATDVADTTISGKAADLDFWLWGRSSIDRLELVGDPILATRLRELCAEVM